MNKDGTGNYSGEKAAPVPVSHSANDEIFMIFPTPDERRLKVPVWKLYFWAQGFTRAKGKIDA